MAQPLAVAESRDLLPSVHPRRNVEEITPIDSKRVRMTILETSSGEPCIDELEVWTDAPPPVNVALSSAGAQVRAAGSLPGYQIHHLTGINDGIYGNGSSWIADEISDSWVEVELQEVARIKRIVWSRDREGNFVDRLITRYRIEVADESGAWRQVASSENRRPLGFESQFIGSNPASNLSVYRFAPFSSEMQDPPNIRQSTMSSTTGERSTEHGLPNNNVASIVQSMDSIVWTLNPGNDSLDSLAKYIPKYATDFLSQFEIRCRVDIPEDLPHWNLSAERRHNLLLIVKEALHNIVKHANAREVRVRLSVEENRFQMTLEDDGIGLSEDVGGKGNGIKNMRSRTQSMGGELALSACASGVLKITVTVSNMEKSFK